MRLRLEKLSVSSSLSLGIAVAFLSVTGSAVAQEVKQNSLFLSERQTRKSAVSLNTGRQDGYKREIDLLADSYLLDSDRISVSSMDELVLTSERQNSMSSYFRMYLGSRDFDNPNTYRNFQEFDESEGVATRYMAFETANMMSKLLLKSPAGNFYRNATQFFRRYKRYTSLKVDRDARGDLKVGQEDTASTPALIDFRINANGSGKVEPRLRIGSNFLIRRDFQDSATILEYNINF